MEKLEIKHLAPYLPYKLKIERLNQYMVEISEDSESIRTNWCDEEGPVMYGFEEFNPILRPLSDLAKSDYDDFKHKYNLMSIDNWEYVNPNSWSLECAIRLFQMHFDVFGLIDAGLAIDINTLK